MAKTGWELLLRLIACIISALALAGCGIRGDEEVINVVVAADGGESSYSLSSGQTVEESLARASIVLGDQDRVSHPLSLPVAKGMRITVRRVREERKCFREQLAFERRLVAYEGIAPNEEQVVRSGKSGAIETCYVIKYEDEIETERSALGQPIVVEEPLDEIVYVGPEQQVEKLPLPGRLSYINNGIVWTIQGNAVNKQPLKSTGDLDSLVFTQSSSGTHLIYSSRAADSDGLLNRLWMVDFAEPSRTIALPPSDVLFAEWQPRSNDVIAYSTAERGLGSAAWKALNNLWLLQIDLESGRAKSIKEIISESPGGRFGWWGAAYRWSPRGDRLAWVNAEALGVVDLASGEQVALGEFAVFKPGQSWIWVSSLSWSHDGLFVASAVHGAPVSGEAPESSPAFDLVISRGDGSFGAVLRHSVGMWSGPAFSPQIGVRRAQETRGYLAWLQARSPHNSNNSEYDLYVADRDGSNQRRIFPPSGARGIVRSSDGLNAEALTWSPDGRYVAVIYQGDLWLVDVRDAAGHQVTFDGGASRPVWTG